MAILHQLFDNKLKDVRKNLLVIFELPWFGRFGLFDGKLEFWVQMSALVLSQTVVNVAVAIFIYRFILTNRGATSSYIYGYGFILPLMLVIPFMLMEYWDLENLAMKTACAASSVLLFFRCLEAMHGFTPSFALKNIKSFSLYYAATVQLDFDPKSEKVVRATSRDTFSKFLKCLALFVQVVLLYSFLKPHHYRLFPYRPLNGFMDLFYWGNLFNNYAMAFLSSLALEIGSTAMGLVLTLVSGIRTIDLNDKPLTKSTSPSDFWGNRWNKLVSSSMKRGVFRPLRQAGCSRQVAALATFLASGLIHEYILAVQDYNSQEREQLTLGSHLVFFLWNGAVLILEHLFGTHPAMQWLANYLPTPIRTALVILTVLPVAMLFTDAYIDNGFYDDFSVGFPQIARLDGSVQ